jgi:hypothetical protein
MAAKRAAAKTAKASNIESDLTEIFGWIDGLVEEQGLDHRGMPLVALTGDVGGAEVAGDSAVGSVAVAITSVETEDPVLASAKAKLDAGVITDAEYKHIVGMHASGGADVVDQTTDVSGSAAQPAAPAAEVGLDLDSIAPTRDGGVSPEGLML